MGGVPGAKDVRWQLEGQAGAARPRLRQAVLSSLRFHLAVSAESEKCQN